MNRRPPRTGVESQQAADDNPWLLRITFVVVPLLFVGCWVLSFNTLREQRQRIVGGPATSSGAVSTPTDSLSVRLAATSVVGPGGVAASPSAITQATAAPSPTARTATTLGTPQATSGSGIAATPGTTASPLPSSSPTSVASPSASAGTTYTVVSGDTLGTISKKYNVPVEDIAAANQLKPPYSLKIGDRLTIPTR